MSELEAYKMYQKNWPKFAREVLDVRLDPEQEKILEAVQVHKRVSVRSGTSRGKDYTAAVCSICFLFLNKPSKVINTGPTGRQVSAIMMPEISRIYRNSKLNLGGRLLSDGIYFEQDDTWYLMGFKSDDNSVEKWSGFHSANLMTVVTEASGIKQNTFNAIEGILQGNSRLLLIYNPNHTSGEAYNSSRSPRYVKFKLSCMDAPNVKAKKILIPGQVDWEWVNDKVNAWCLIIDESSIDKSKHDFLWEGFWRRPNDMFRVKVLGEFPAESEDTLIPLSWIEASNERWIDYTENNLQNHEPLRLGVDVCGMGRDKTMMAPRYGNYVARLKEFNQVKDSTIHMRIAGIIRNELQARFSAALIDTIGEGAGVLSRLHELNVMNAVSAKFSEGAKNLSDFTGHRKFANMRSWCYWGLRDALDPANKINLMLPPDDEITQELTETKYIVRSDGSYIIEPKEEIKKRINRSPDKADAVALSFFPYSEGEESTEELTKIFY